MTALALPGYLQGKNCSLLGVQGVSADAVRALTFSNVDNYDMHSLGIFDTFEYEGRFNGFELHPADFTIENWLGTVDGFDLTIGEIERNNAFSLLMVLWHTYSFLRFEADTIAPGGSTTVKLAILATPAGGTCRKGLVEEKNGVIATFKPCGAPIFYGSGSPPF